MENHRKEFDVESMSRVLGVSRSGYYCWRSRKPSRRSEEDVRILARIIELHANSDRTYGSPRILNDLKEEGERLGRNRVSRLMKENRLFSRHKRRFRITTNSHHEFPIAENLLERDFTASSKDEKWVSDITYIPTGEGWLYLAVVIDLFSRRVVGWSMGDKINRSLPMRALKMALEQRSPSSRLIHHSDRGSQYASNEYRSILAAHAIVPSMSRGGNCWDNAVAESFFKTLKIERVYHRRYRTRQQAREDLFDYIEVFYNRKRKHSANGLRSPVDFERLNMAA